jgi:hypothetical protein
MVAIFQELGAACPRKVVFVLKGMKVIEKFEMYNCLVKNPAPRAQGVIDLFVLILRFIPAARPQGSSLK